MVESFSVGEQTLVAGRIDSASNSVITAFTVASISLIIYGVFYPGLINFDTAEMLNQAMLGYCRDWHSPTLVLIWRALNLVVPGPASLLGLGLLLFSASALYLARWSTVRLFPCLAIVALLCFWPPLLDALVVVGKDQLFITCLMLFIALSLTTLQKGRLTGATLLWLIPLLFVAGGVRQDSAVLLTPTLFLLYRLPRGRSLSSWGWKMAGAMAVISVVAAFAAVKISNRFVARAEREFPFQTTQVHDLAGIAVRTDHALIPSYADPGFDAIAVKGRYTPRTGDTLMFFPGQPNLQITNLKERADELQSLWTGAVLRYPRAYLQHRLASFIYLLGIEQPLSYQLYQLDTDLTMHAAYPLLTNVNIGNPDNATIAYYRKSVIPALETTPMFRGYAYDLVIILEIGLALWRRSPRDRLIVAIGCGALLHQSLLFFVSPAALFRYLYPSILTCLVMTILTLTRNDASRGRAT